MNLIFLGAPGVGKGTYTSRIKDKYGLVHISTGDLFRENMKNNTPLGIEAKGYIEKGQLVPDEVTINMLKDRLKKDDTKNGFILDGFPRTIPQADALGKFAKIDKVINFVADEDVIIRRLSGRRICRKCQAIYHVDNIPTKVEGVCDKCGGEVYQRDDDKPEAIKERLKVYEKQTAPLIDYYKEKGMLAVIDASVDINNPNCHIIKDTEEVLDKLK